MAQVLCYIKKGEGVYDYTYYPEHLHAMNCDWEHAMHLAVREDQENFHPLRNNTGILFPKATFHEGPPQGTTKTLIDPWLYRRADGRFGVFGIRRNQNAPDPLTIGEIMLFESDDLVRYDEVGFLKVSDGEIRHPKSCYNQQKGYYDVSWEENGKTLCGQTKYFKEVCNITEIQPETSEMQEWGIEGAVYGNILDISKEELQTIRESLDEICHVGNEQIELKAVKGEEIILPDKIRCYYSDGSEHQKKVCWNNEDLKMLQQADPGSYEVRGEKSSRRAGLSH